MNPLLVVIAESRRNGDAPANGLLKVMMALQGHMGPQCVLLAAQWDETFGEPTWEKLAAFAESFLADPGNADLAARLRDKHERVMAGLAPDGRRRIESYFDPIPESER